MKSDNNTSLSHDDWDSLMFHFPVDHPYGIDVFLKSMPEIKQIQHDRDHIFLYADLDAKAILTALAISEDN